MGALLDTALALDPVRLAERVGIQPDGWQADVLRSNADRILLNCCRQSGKSTTTATLAVWTALYQPGSLVLLLAPAQRQSVELFRKCAEVYHAAGRPIPPGAESALRVEMDNGSRIVALPGRDDASIRGFSGVRLLLIDEAARVADDTYRAVRPMLAVSGGRLVALSTPWGKRGWWHHEWIEGGDGWERVEVPATDCPRISPAFLEEERKSLGPLYFASEYECRFVETIDSVFRLQDINAALDPTVLPLFATAA